MQPTQGGPNRTDTPCPAGAGLRPGLVLLAAGAPGRRSGLLLGPTAHARAAATVGVGRLAADEGAGQVGVEDQPPLLEREVLGLLADVGARVIHQDVEPAEATLGLGQHGAAGL